MGFRNTMDLKTPTVRFVKTHQDARLPKANDESKGIGDSGYDLYAVQRVKLWPGIAREVPVGLTLGYVEPGYWIRVEARSGLSFKHQVLPHNGVLDNGYRGDLGVLLYNHGDHIHIVEKGDRIAQLVIYPLIQPVVEWALEVDETSRGSKGLGSSGK